MYISLYTLVNNVFDYKYIYRPQVLNNQEIKLIKEKSILNRESNYTDLLFLNRLTDSFNSMSLCHLRLLRSTSMNTTQNKFLSCGFLVSESQMWNQASILYQYTPELILYSLKSWKLSLHSGVTPVLRSHVP